MLLWSGALQLRRQDVSSAQPVSRSKQHDVAASPRAPRFAAVDRLRGLIMAIMAIDHASLFIAHRHSSEVWNGHITSYTSAFPFLTRFATHLCAPGFFFTMGIGMAMFADSREKLGWSHGRIARYMITRGLLLILVNELVENPAWLLGMAFQAEGGSGPPDGSYLLFGVLSALGVVMAIGGLLLEFGSTVWLLLSVGVLIGTNVIVPGLVDRIPTDLRFVLVPGHRGIATIIYPALPWFPLAGLGFVYGRWLRKNSATALRATPWIGIALIAAALAIRAIGGFGNTQLPRDGSWIEFLNFVKYPPAMVFVLFTLGCDLTLLAALSVRDNPVTRVLIVYGRAPLCFYLAHLYLFGSMAALFFRHAVSLQAMYLVWFAGLIPLYFICDRYGSFKQAKPADSVWRLF